jgi:hypothetical protein
MVLVTLEQGVRKAQPGELRRGGSKEKIAKIVLTKCLRNKAKT